MLVAVLGSLLEHGDGYGLQVGEHVFPLRHVWRPFTASRCRGLAEQPKLFFFLDPCGQISDVSVSFNFQKSLKYVIKTSST